MLPFCSPMMMGAAAGGAPSFDPTQLFQSGEAGGWWDVQDLSTMFQNSDGTTSVAVGDPVGYLADKSGNGNHLIQATAGARPILRQDGGGFYYLECDGSDDRLTVAFALSQPFYRCSVINQAVWTNGRCLMGGGSAQAGVLQQASVSPQIRFYSGSSSISRTASLAVGEKAVVYEGHGVTEGSFSNRFRKNFGTVENMGTGSGTNAPGGLTVGADYNVGTLFGRVNFYGAIVNKGDNTLEADHLTNIINYLAGECGVSV